MTRNAAGDAIFTAKEMRQMKRLLAVVLVLGPTIGAGASKSIDAVSRTQPIDQKQIDRIEHRIERIEQLLMERNR